MRTRILSNSKICLERFSLTMLIRNKWSLFLLLSLGLIATLLIPIVIFPISYVEASNSVDFTKWASITGQTQDELKKRYSSMSSAEKTAIAEKFANIKKLEEAKKDASKWDIKSLQKDETFWQKGMWEIIKKTPGGDCIANIKDAYRWLQKKSCAAWLYGMQGKFIKFVDNRRDSLDDDPKGKDDAWNNSWRGELIYDHAGKHKQKDCETKTTKEWKGIFEGGYQIIRGAEKGIKKIEEELQGEIPFEVPDLIGMNYLDAYDKVKKIHSGFTLDGHREDGGIGLQGTIYKQDPEEDVKIEPGSIKVWLHCELESLEIKPKPKTNLKPEPGVILEYEVWAKYKHADKKDVTSKATWGVTSGSPASKTGKGEFSINNDADDGKEIKVKAEYTSGGVTKDVATSVTVQSKAFSSIEIRIQDKSDKTDSIAMKPKDTEILIAYGKYPKPKGGSDVIDNKKVNWISDDASVVSVNNDTGEITAIKEGCITITAQFTTAKSKILKDTVKVNVTSQKRDVKFIVTDKKKNPLAKVEVKAGKKDEAEISRGKTDKNGILHVKDFNVGDYEATFTLAGYKQDPKPEPFKVEPQSKEAKPAPVEVKIELEADIDSIKITDDKKQPFKGKSINMKPKETQALLVIEVLKKKIERSLTEDVDKVKFTSANEKVAKIKVSKIANSKWILTAGSAGSTSITASYGGLTDTLSIKVSKDTRKVRFTVIEKDTKPKKTLSGVEVSIEEVSTSKVPKVKGTTGKNGILDVDLEVKKKYKAIFTLQGYKKEDEEFPVSVSQSTPTKLLEIKISLEVEKRKVKFTVYKIDLKGKPTQKPVYNAEVVVTGGKSGISDKKGEVTIDELVVNKSYTVTVRKNGFKGGTAVMTIPPSKKGKAHLTPPPYKKTFYLIETKVPEELKVQPWSFNATDRGEREQLTATVMYSNGDEEDVTDKTSWTSSDDSVVTVTMDGEMIVSSTASDGDNCVITAYYSGKARNVKTPVLEGTCKVWVVLDMSVNFTVNPSSPISSEETTFLVDFKNSENVQKTDTFVWYLRKHGESGNKIGTGSPLTYIFKDKDEYYVELKVLRNNEIKAKNEKKISVEAKPAIAKGYRTDWRGKLEGRKLTVTKHKWNTKKRAFEDESSRTEVYHNVDAWDLNTGKIEQAPIFNPGYLVYASNGCIRYVIFSYDVETVHAGVGGRTQPTYEFSGMISKSCGKIATENLGLSISSVLSRGFVVTWNNKDGSSCGATIERYTGEVEKDSYICEKGKPLVAPVISFEPETDIDENTLVTFSVANETYNPNCTYVWFLDDEVTGGPTSFLAMKFTAGEHTVGLSVKNRFGAEKVGSGATLSVKKVKKKEPSVTLDDIKKLLEDGKFDEANQLLAEMTDEETEKVMAGLTDEELEMILGEDDSKEKPEITAEDIKKLLAEGKVAEANEALSGLSDEVNDAILNKLTVDELDKILGTGNIVEYEITTEDIKKLIQTGKIEEASEILAELGDEGDEIIEDLPPEFLDELLSEEGMRDSEITTEHIISLINDGKKDEANKLLAELGDEGDKIFDDLPPELKDELLKEGKIEGSGTTAEDIIGLINDDKKDVANKLLVEMGDEGDKIIDNLPPELLEILLVDKIDDDPEKTGVSEPTLDTPEVTVEYIIGLINDDKKDEANKLLAAMGKDGDKIIDDLPFEQLDILLMDEIDDDPEKTGSSEPTLDTPEVTVEHIIGLINDGKKNEANELLVKMGDDGDKIIDELPPDLQDELLKDGKSEEPITTAVDSQKKTDISKDKKSQTVIIDGKEYKLHTQVYHYSNGNIKQRFTYYEDGGSKVKHGRHEAWFENGSMFDIIDYRHGKKHGEYINYQRNPDGSTYLSYSGTYKDGKQHGNHKSYRPEGDVVQDNNFFEGLAHGSHIYYQRAGVKQTENHYNMGKQDGVSKSWTVSGILQSESTYMNGRITYTKGYDQQTGKLQCQGSYGRNGNRCGTWKYYPPRWQD